MKTGMRSAVLSAAVMAVFSGGSLVQAADLIWNPLLNPSGGSDGTGNWDNSTVSWYNAQLGTNVKFNSSTPDSVTIGTTPGATGTALPNYVAIAENITAQNITLSTAANGATYNLFDQGDGLQTLTLNGNFFKTGATGAPQVALTNAMVLSAGSHTIAVRDSPGDASPELLFNSALTGAGSVVIDNTLNYAGPAGDIQYGTTAFTVNNSYTGGTTVQSGRLLVDTAGGLGTGAVTVQGAGALGFGGGGTATSGDLTITNPIKITRSDYTTDQTNNRYTTAVAAYNDGSFNTISINGPLDIASTDARIGAFSNRVVINSNITSSTGNGVLRVDGDFAGFVRLNGNNAGLAVGGVNIGPNVELEVTNDSNLGGASAPLTFSGGTFHPIGGFLTNFGSHVINNATFNGGIDTDAGTTFNVDQVLGSTTTAVGSFSKRGTGTLNFNQTVNLRGGQTYWDAGIVNINAPTTFANIHLRSPVVNINQGGSITTTAGYNSLGQDTTGTNGGPDIAVVNITGNGQLIQTSGDDFNVSDNANTKGTINLGGNGVLTTGGLTFLGKQSGAVGTINQTGGTFTVNRGGDFALVIGRDNGQGVYNLSGGTMTSAGEVYVGQGFGDGTSGNGQWNQTGGTATINNWFVIGREGGKGAVDISGGTLVKKGGGNVPIGEGGNNTRTNSFTVRGTGTFDAQTGEVWVSNGNNTTTMNVQDSGTVNVNNYFVVGRFGDSKGILNLSGNGTINKATSNPIIIGAGGGSNGVVNQTGGTVNNLTTETWIGDGGVGTWNQTAGTINAGIFDIGHDGGGVAVMNMSGTAALNAGNVRVGEAGNGTTGTLNFNGGTITADRLFGDTATGAKVVNFNGGQLIAKSDQAAFVTGLSTAAVQAGGVKINTNGHAVTASQAFTHDTALGGTVDGGLAKTGLGTLTLSGANTYTGTTSITNGTLVATAPAYTSNLLANSAGVDLGNSGGILQLDYTGTTSPVATVKSILTAGYANRFATGQIRSSTLASDRTIGYGDNGTLVTARVTLAGDANLDGTVNFNDFLILQNNFGKADTRFDQGNFNYDGVTNFNDFLALQNNFGKSVGFGPTAVTAAEYAQVMSITSASEVPEPATLAVLGLATAGVLRRRRSVR